MEQSSSVCSCSSSPSPSPPPPHQGIFVMTEVLPTTSNPSSVMYYTQSPATSINGDDPLSRITSPCWWSSSSSSSPPPTFVRLPAGATLGYDPAVGEMRIIYMLGPKIPHYPASSDHRKLSAFQKSELSKVIFGVVAPVTMGLLALMSNYSPQLYSTLPHWLMPFVVCTLSFGSTFIFHGILFREMYPRFARALEEIGVLIILLGFFSLVTTIIPRNVIWSIWSCYFLTLSALVVLRIDDEVAANTSTSSAAR